VTFSLSGLRGVRKGRYAIADSFYDAAVSGCDPVDTRAGFAALLVYCEANIRRRHGHHGRTGMRSN
jgi:hypothetical protein